MASPESDTQMTKPPFTYVEDCTSEELSLNGIRTRAKAFNETFAKNGGYKGYEAQAIDVLLAEIDRLLQVQLERDVLVDELAELRSAAEPSGELERKDEKATY